MQVKKYEARSMNEALEMVKRDLGPDAIILSARDRRGKFGLVGDGSFEITAAVSEETLQKRRFAESRMKADLREKFQNSPARVQREIMNDFADNFTTKAPAAGASVRAQVANVNRVPTSRRYIDIEDDTNVEAEQASHRVRDAAQRAWEALRETESRAQSTRAAAPKAPPQPKTQASVSAQTAVGASPFDRAVRAASDALRRQAPAPAAAQGGMEMLDEATIRQTLQAEARAVAAAVTPAQTKMDQSQNEIMSLKSELESLKSVLRDFQKVPQNLNGSHPGAEYGLSYDFSASFEKLTQAGISAAIAGEILQTAQSQLPTIKHKSRGLIDGFAAKYILDSTKIAGAAKSRLQVFVGPRGSGKTSALVKMASHAVVNGHRNGGSTAPCNGGYAAQSKVALITADNQKVGAVDQMRIFAQILNVPFGVVRKAADWKPLLEQLKGFDMILCDLPGMSLKTMEEISLLKSLMPPEACDVHLVLSACSKDAELEETCRRFDAVKFNDFIFNHLDEALIHGSIYNLMRKFERPLHSFGVGPQVPEDFEAATKERVLDLIFKLTKFKRASAE
ncbi:MAG: flagellar biosynthesis protein FlhF [Bdellovibrionaceae bacterium]|nr:flagellar biosynthesis protein FlhF [Pseudobdellovibrionaceae bacterium]